MGDPGSQFEGSIQHHDFYPDGGHATYARCESCMYGSHYDTVTWHSWAGAEDLDEMTPEQRDIALTQKCACDCAGPRGATRG